jgi:putative transposase
MGEKKPGYSKLSQFVTKWRLDPETEWFEHSLSQILQQSLLDLEKAWTNIFEKGAELPKFIKKGLMINFGIRENSRSMKPIVRFFFPKSVGFGISTSAIQGKL